MVANTLHAAAILLREGGDWDWFINLSATDYPLVTQDGEFFCVLVLAGLDDGLKFVAVWVYGVNYWIWFCAFVIFGLIRSAAYIFVPAKRS